MKRKNSEIRCCCICGAKETDTIVQSTHKKLYCKKHLNQIYRHGKITDETPSTKRGTCQKNEIIIKDDYAIIIIKSKKLENHVEVMIDKEDVERVSIRNWNVAVQGKSINVYGYLNNRNVKLSRYILDYHGENFVDHINRNTLDNRKSNLRIVTPAENAQNRGDVGIYTTPSGRWKSIITFYGKTYRLGTYDTYNEALEARKKKAIELTNNTEYKEKFYALKPERNVSPQNGKWVAYISIRGKRKTIGAFETKEEAIIARNMAELQKMKIVGG